MDGGAFGNTGVSLLSGSGLTIGDSLTLVSGGRQWRMRLPSSKESQDNILVIEYKLGVEWKQAAVYIVPPN